MSAGNCFYYDFFPNMIGDSKKLDELKKAIITGIARQSKEQHDLICSFFQDKVIDSVTLQIGVMSNQFFDRDYEKQKNESLPIEIFLFRDLFTFANGETTSFATSSNISFVLKILGTEGEYLKQELPISYFPVVLKALELDNVFFKCAHDLD